MEAHKHPATEDTKSFCLPPADKLFRGAPPPFSPKHDNSPCNSHDLFCVETKPLISKSQKM